MKLSEAPLEKLQKHAAKLGVKYSAKTSREKLITLIRAAKEAAKAEPGPEPEPEAPTLPDTWPKEWPKEMRHRYYAEIVGEKMPKDPQKAWDRLKKAIIMKGPDAELVRTNIGFSCFGVWYAPQMRQCSTQCPVMPLCQYMCATRPELKDEVRELEKAACELQEQQQAEAAAEQEDDAEVEAPKPRKGRKAKAVVEPEAEEEQLPEPEVEAEEEEQEPPKKRGRKKKDTAPTGQVQQVTPLYEWVGDVADYEDDDMDEDDHLQLKVLKWMSKRKKGFTAAELAKQLEKLGVDPDSGVDMLEALEAEEDVKLLDIEAA